MSGGVFFVKKHPLRRTLQSTMPFAFQSASALLAVIFLRHRRWLRDSGAKQHSWSELFVMTFSAWAVGLSALRSDT